MAQESFAKTVLDAVSDLAASSGAFTGQASVGEISDALMIQTTAQHKRMLNTLSDLKKAGRILRVSQGVYALAAGTDRKEIREVMWRLLRMRKRVTVDDLVEMAGASVEYARDWLRMLEDRGVVRKITKGAASNPRVWQLIVDTVEMPVDAANAARLRELRKKRKQQALKDLAEATNLIGRAYGAIKEMED